MLGDFRHGQAREESQCYDRSAAWINRFQTRERAFEGEEILHWYRGGLGRVQQIVEFDMRETAASLLALLMTAVIHKHAPHGLRG